jgi:hypothetical protein
MKKIDKTYTATFTDKELNYLWKSLHDSVLSMRRSGMAKMGNVPQLIWFTVRLRNKISRIHYPERKR